MREVRSRKRCLYLALGLVAGLLVCQAGWAGVSDELELRSTGVVIDADVHDSRVINSKYGVNYDVFYTFAVPGKAERIGLRDPLLWWRTNLWAAIPRKEWQKAEKDRKIAVLYLASDPYLNRPVCEETPLNGPLFLAIIGAILAVYCSIGIIREMKRRCSSREEYYIDIHFNFYPGREFAFFFLAGLFFGWLAVAGVMEAIEDNGPMNVRAFELDGLAATIGRWILAAFGILLTLILVFACGRLLFNNPGRIAFAPRGVFLPRDRFATEMDFVTFDDITEVSLDSDSEPGRDKPDSGLHFVCSKGQFAIARQGFSKQQFEEICGLFRNRANRAKFR